MLLSRLVVWLVAVGTILLVPNAGNAQAYPNKPIRILTPGPGGSAEYVTRLIAQGISGPMGQQIIVDGRPALVSAEIAAKASPDGYTLLLSGSFWLFPLFQKVAFDPVKDFSPVTWANSDPYALVAHPSLAAKSAKELIVLAKAKPGEINYGSGPTGGVSHLAGALFDSMAGVNIVRVPYKSSAQALTAMIGGEVQVMFMSVSSVPPHLKAGRLRALAVTSPQPSALMPDLPTLAAAGLPGYEAVTINGAFAPAKTPKTIIRRLNQEIVRFLNMPDTKERLLASGTEPVGSSPEELAVAVKADIATVQKLIKEGAIRVE